MKIAVVWFTCKRDAKLFDISLRSVRRLEEFTPHTWTYHAAVDASEVSEFVQTEGVQLISTSFDRQGNLNGPECVEKMLSTMQCVAISTGADYVLKIDSDVKVMGAKWLDHLDPRKWGLVGGRRNFIYAWGVWGGAYCIAGQALKELTDIPKAVEEANLFRYRKLEPSFPEDETVSALFNSAYPDNVLQVSDSAPWTGWIERFRYENEDPRYWSNYEFVEFGGNQDQIYWTDSPDRCTPENIDAVAQVMGRVCRSNVTPELPAMITDRNAKPYIGVYNRVGHFDYFGPAIRHFERKGRFIHYMDHNSFDDIENKLNPCDILFLWNGQTDEYRKVREVAERMGKKVIISEVGFFSQKDYSFFDLKGITAGSSLMDDPLDWVTRHMKNTYEKFRRQYAPRKLGEAYVLVPLQLETDTNFRSNCDFETMQEFVNHCCEKFRGETILFKRHPKDSQTYDTQGHQLMTGDADVMTGARYAKLVYGVSSTSLLECALMEGVEVEAIGNGFLRKQQDRDTVLAALVALQVHKHADYLPPHILQRLGLEHVN